MPALILAAVLPVHAEQRGEAVRLLSLESNGLVFEFLSGEIMMEEVQTGQAGEIFQLLRLPDCDLNIREGAPMVPVQGVNIAIPPGAKVSFTILEDQFEERPGFYLAPGPRAYRSGAEGTNIYQQIYQPDPQIYAEDAFSPVQICAAGPTVLMRHQQILPLVLSPVQFNPISRTVRIHQRIVVEVRFLAGSQDAGGENFMDLFEGIYRSTLLNYDQARSWRQSQPAQVKGTFEDPFSTAEDWFKISTRAAGICRLTPEDLETAGLDVAMVDPASIKIYNIGKKVLPRTIGDPPIMSQVPILVTGQDDGQLNPGDEILFYAVDLAGWDQMSQAGYHEYANPYTNDNVYWLTYGGEAGIRMSSRSGQPQSNTYIQAEQFRTTAHQERDFLNAEYSGLTWYWDSMTGHWSETEEYRLTLTAVMAESCVLRTRMRGIYYKPSATIPSSIPHHVFIYLNDADEPAIERLWYDAVAIETEEETQGLRSGTNILTVSLPRAESEWDHILFDWFEIEYWRGYEVEGDQLHFSSPEASGVLQYDLAGFSQDGMRLLDISDPYLPVVIGGGTVSAEGQLFTLRFQDDLTQGEAREYTVATPGAYLIPHVIERRIPASLRQVSADVIMVTPQAFRERLQPLVDLRREQGWRVAVSTIEDIYDQFAWGLVDPTALRDYLRHAFYQGEPPVPAYVLLFGDGNFDYKNNSGAGAGNWVPPYESGDLCTDDWFVRMDGDHLVDMMIGRLPVRSLDEADVIVGKIVDYDRVPVFGPWRNRVMIVSDDETADGGVGNELFHARDSEDLARRFVPPSYDLHKVYLMEYPMSWSDKKPEAQQAVIDGFNQGMLWVNWIGHGNFDVWAHEDAFRGSNDIPRLNNAERLPLVYAASCDVGRFDHTLNESIAEELLRVESKGAVATIGATRYCYATPNAELNKEAIRRILGEDQPTVGEGFFGAKLSRPNSNSNDQKYALFADPCMRLGSPSLESRIVQISSDTLRALDHVTMRGQVYVDEAPDTTFNGTASVQVFDSARPTTYTTALGSKVNYTLPGATIFRGSSMMEAGHFRTTFVVPKDISYGGRSAKISAYLHDEQRDGLAYRDSLPVQGTATAVADTMGPEILLSVSGQEFASGDLTSSHPTMMAFLEDENGINITGEVGHWIVMTIDDGDQQINVTDRFEYDSGSYQRGSLSYGLENLEVGSHTVAMKAWDNFNNFSLSTLTFEVTEDQELELRNVLNCPNPFDPRSEETRFTYQLTRPAEVTIKVYTVAGRLIRTIEAGQATQGYNESQLWGGEDQDGDRVANGVYLYKVVARSEGRSAEAYGKVVVMR